MKICLITAFYSPYEPGGAPIAVRILAEALKKQGHDVFIITTGPYEGLKSLKPRIRYEKGIKVYYFYPLQPNIPVYTKKYSGFSLIFTFLLNFWNPHTYFVIRNILKKENPSIIDVKEVHNFLSNSVYSVIKTLNIPYIYTIYTNLLLFPVDNLPLLDKLAGIKYPLLGYNYNVYKVISKIYQKINKIIIDSPEHVLFDSNSVKNLFNNHNFFKDSEKIVFPIIFKTNKHKLKNLSKNTKTIDILYRGTIRHKGGQTLIQAFKQIPNKNLRLHIFGGGRDEKFFKELAEGDERINFYGWISNDERDRLYQFADLTVMPSIYFETFGMVIVESFMAGVPVIGSNVGAIPELIKEGYNGWLFESGNVEQLKERLEYAIKNKDKLKKMRKNCIKTAEKYSVENNIHRLEEIYREMLKRYSK